jgi:hypothetical protein
MRQEDMMNDTQLKATRELYSYVARTVAQYNLDQNAVIEVLQRVADSYKARR